MVLVNNSYDEQAIGRMLELVSPAAPWYRRLWHSGPLLVAGELLDSGSRGTSPAARRELHAELVNCLRDDAGIGGRHAAAVRSALPKDAKDLEAGSHAWHGLQAATASVRTDYLARWASRVRSARNIPADFLARRTVAHLLDSGWSATHVHRWVTYRAKYSSARVDVADILEEASATVNSPPKEFEFCVPLGQAPHLPRPTPDGWLTSREVAVWRSRNTPQVSAVRQYGGAIFTVSAPDVYAAADAVRNQLASLVARFAVGGRRTLRPTGDMWVRGFPDTLPVDGSPRRVEVHSFERMDQLFSRGIPEPLTSALTLIAPLDRGAPAAAITGAWAAVESLMTGPSDGPKTVAADRMALVIAASYLRAELTVLAWAHSRAADDTIAQAVSWASENRARAAIMERAIAGGHPATVQRDVDAWALARVSTQCADPRTSVLAVQRIVRRALLRLYRHRNSIMHSGRTDATGFEAALRIGAPLVAAGLDRVAHAMLNGERVPLAMAARARVRLETLVPATSANDSGVVDLLER